MAHRKRKFAHMKKRMAFCLSHGNTPHVIRTNQGCEDRLCIRCIRKYHWRVQ